jgi:MerR family transcriptional regulator, light-induced transcriptional regulator
MSELKQELYLSPADLAESLGLSVSTLKRWSDKGVLKVERTAGGHRRIAMTEVLRFVRDSGLKPVLPAKLGLGREAATATASAAASKFGDLLFEGETEEARRLLVSAFSMGEHPALLGDRWIRPAMERIGERWKHGDEGVAFEHQATDAVVRAVSEMRAKTEPASDAPVAVGASVQGDPYMLPTAIASLVLSVDGFRPFNLGADLPPAALVAAVERRKPKLVWLSASVLDAEGSSRASLDVIASKLSRKGFAVVVGGRAAPPRVKGAVVLSDFASLSAYARGLVA